VRSAGRPALSANLLGVFAPLDGVSISFLWRSFPLLAVLRARAPFGRAGQEGGRAFVSLLRVKRVAVALARPACGSEARMVGSIFHAQSEIYIYIYCNTVKRNSLPSIFFFLLFLLFFPCASVLSCLCFHVTLAVSTESSLVLARKFLLVFFSSSVSAGRFSLPRWGRKRGSLPPQSWLGMYIIRHRNTHTF